MSLDGFVEIFCRASTTCVPEALVLTDGSQQAVAVIQL